MPRRILLILLCCCLPVFAAVAAPRGSVQQALPAPVAVGLPAANPAEGDNASEPARVMDPEEFWQQAQATRSGDAPVALDDAYLVQSGQTLAVPAANGLLVNDLDPEGDAFWANSYYQPNHGTANLTTDGGFSYTPEVGYVGEDTFHYAISDGTSLSSFSAVTILVLPAANRPPVPMADGYLVMAGASLDVAGEDGLLINDHDPDGDSIMVVSYSPPAHGSLNLVTDGSFTYTPDAGFVGNEIINYTISDGQADNVEPGLITLKVAPSGNRAPVAQVDLYYTPANTLLTVAAAEGLARNDLDPDGDTFVVANFYSPAHGTLSLYTNGAFTYQPDARYVGTDSIQYRLQDANGVYSEYVVATFLVGVYGDIAAGVLTPPAADAFTLRAPVPNPFNPSTGIAFRTEEDGRVQLRIYNLRGEVVADLVDEDRPAGEYTETWTGRDVKGQQMASGTYVAELKQGANRAVQKLTLVK